MKLVLVPLSARAPLNSTQLQIHSLYQKILGEAFHELLGKKHLYQHVKIDDSPVVEAIKSAQVDEEALSEMVVVNHRGDFQKSTHKECVELLQKEFLGFANSIGGGVWKLKPGNTHPLLNSITGPEGKTDNTYTLPNVRIACTFCGSTQPHNSGFHNLKQDNTSCDIGKDGTIVQVFMLAYQCQNCHGEPIHFMVRREGMKITLVGRSHFEAPEVPGFISKEVVRFYRNAVISRNCNQVLSGLFQLRTLVEQHMRTAIKDAFNRLTGDELGDRYSQTLPADFAGHFPSLKKVYENLSVAIHSASDDVQIFETELAEINAHFEALQIFHKQAARTRKSV